eukprot:12982644-Alexandrium_andersonii.AAC.1
MDGPRLHCPARLHSARARFTIRTQQALGGYRKPCSFQQLSREPSRLIDRRQWHADNCAKRAGAPFESRQTQLRAMSSNLKNCACGVGQAWVLSGSCGHCRARPKQRFDPANTAPKLLSNATRCLEQPSAGLNCAERRMQLLESD